MNNKLLIILTIAIGLIYADQFRRKTFASLVFTKVSTNSCQWLKELKHQNKQCNLLNISTILAYSKNLTVSSCQQQFMYEQWNCSVSNKIFNKVYKETSFMTALSAASLMYSVVVFCQKGLFLNCKCGTYHRPEPSKEWKWGGCSHDTHYAKSFTTKFLQLKKKGNSMSAMYKFNSLVGLDAVSKSLKKVCRCHGLSGSCSYKTCWRQIKDHSTIAAKLKDRYFNAIPLSSAEEVLTLKKTKPRNLVYLYNLPNNCATQGRYCKNEENCATLCCSRPFFSEVYEEVNKFCKCRWKDQKLFILGCDPCTINKTRLVCS